MGKLDDYEFKNLPQQLVDFKDDVREVINNSKLQFAITTGTPTYAANTGELAIYLGGLNTSSGSAVYIRTGSNWSLAFKFTQAG